MKIAIIGDGNVGSALRRGLSRGGHDVAPVGKAAIGLTSDFRRVRWINRVLAFCLVATVASNWILVRMLLTSAPWSELGLALILLFAPLAGSVVGLLRMREWGFYCAYLLFPVSTLLHSMPLVPFASGWIPTLPLRISSLLMVNVLFLVATTVSHMLYRRSRRVAARVESDVASERQGC